MTLSALIPKRDIATATLATFATVLAFIASCVAGVATVAVANLYSHKVRFT